MKKYFVPLFILLGLIIFTPKAFALPSEGGHFSTPTDLFGSSVIKRGAKGIKVQEIQNILTSDCGGNSSIVADGKFGLKTETALKNFQRIKNLKVDGYIGNLTKYALWDCARETM